MTLYRCVIMGLAMTALGLPADANAAGSKQDEDAIRQAGKAYVKALQAGDAKTLKQFWTADGKFVDAGGESFSAHALIDEQFGGDATASQTPSTDAPVDHESSIRFITDSVALERGETTTPTNGTSSYTAIWVKQDGRWRLNTLHERGSTSSTDNHLEELRWMIGDWVGQGDGFRVTCSTNWSDGGKFIVRRFHVERDGQVVHSGSQRIGWDAAQEKIRSWAFDNSGGIVEGVWRREGDAWVVKSDGTLPDGSQSNTVEFWVKEGPNRCAVKFGHTEVGENEMQDSVVEFHRIIE